MNYKILIATQARLKQKEIIQAIFILKMEWEEKNLLSKIQALSSFKEEFQI